MRFQFFFLFALAVWIGRFSAHAADTLDPVNLLQEASTSVQNDEQSDSDQWRLKVVGDDGADSLASEASVPCYDATSDVTTLLQPDLASIAKRIMALSTSAIAGAVWPAERKDRSVSVRTVNAVCNFCAPQPWACRKIRSRRLP